MLRLHKLLRVPLLFFACAPLLAQIGPALEQGLNPYQLYEGGQIDRIGVTNGNLYIHIPLLNYPQRGILRLSFSLQSNNKGWAITHNPSSYYWLPSAPLASLGTTEDGVWSGGIQYGGDCHQGTHWFTVKAKSSDAAAHSSR